MANTTPLSATAMIKACRSGATVDEAGAANAIVHPEMLDRV
ncbi:MAG: hypothetical protein WAN86_01730 [Hyphomicrobiaceae bacterium]